MFGSRRDEVKRQRGPGSRRALAVVLGASLIGSACRERETAPSPAPAPARAPQSAAHPSAPVGDENLAIPPPKSSKAREIPEPARIPESCPEGTKRIPGGSFWVGTRSETYEREENPRFSTRLAPFCADSLEVSTAEYEDCVAAGKCSPQRGKSKTCNSVEKGKGDHPINCIDFEQATAVCAARGARLPTEIEWEYMARGGAEMRKYPWGDAHPDGNTCWKHGGTCVRGQFSEEAFGLHDVAGNVWEWTSSWFGHYPWPEKVGRHRVYRGGSWSRRFEKWMRPNLRNRLDPKGSGSHLGVRCVVSLPDVECPYGKDADGNCRFGVDEVDCLDGDVWNGVRCARKGDERRCLPGANEEPGWGCTRPPVEGHVEHELDTASVTRRRSPEFDADCQKNAPGRPHAYRFEGGGHLARNVVGKRAGCKNRDVGVGFNSSCCP